MNNVSITCSARGYPIPEIKWKFRNSVVSGSINYQREKARISSVIQFDQVSARKHGGLYECIASNDLGTKRVNISANCEFS